MKYGIVVVGYQKDKAIERLLNRLNQADYCNDEILLIISIDKGNNENLERIVKSFRWMHGKCVLKLYEEQLGLKKHVLTCGSYMEEYDLDAIAVFEDDIYPSLSFYNYMRQAVEYYAEDNKIAGISLYAYARNDMRDIVFTPAYSGYDTYFVQFASSWGQIWLRKQWRDFINWFENQNEEIMDDIDMDSHIKNWPATSWLKWHMAYCRQQNKYFVYPYMPLSTCFGEVGVHTKIKTSIYQVPLIEDITDKIYYFQPSNQMKVSYDCYFEREQISEWLHLKDSELCIDLYGRAGGGIDKKEARYLLTTQRYPYKILESYGLEMYPHEMNILEKIEGEAITLYDTQEEIKMKQDNYEIDKMSYYYKVIRGKFWYIQYGLSTGLRKLKTIIVSKRKRE